MARGVTSGRHHIQGVHVGEIAGGIFLRQFGGRNAALVGPVDDLVLDIRHVLDVFELIAAKFDIAADDVKKDIAHGMAEMAVIVRRYAANIHLDRVADGHELLFLSGHRR